MQNVISTLRQQNEQNKRAIDVWSDFICFNSHLLITFMFLHTFVQQDLFCELLSLLQKRHEEVQYPMTSLYVISSFLVGSLRS